MAQQPGSPPLEGGHQAMTIPKQFKIEPLVVNPEAVRKRKAFFEIEPGDEQLLREIQQHLAPHEAGIMDRFYDFLLSQDQIRRLLSAPGLVDRLKILQIRYFQELTQGKYEREYFENRLRVGFVHQRVGLPLEWYLGAYRKYLGILRDTLRESYRSDRVQFIKVMSTLTKIVFLDMSLAIDAYTYSGQEALAQKASELEQANTKLRELDESKRHLTGAIVHDLQNPLAGIIAFLQVLETRPAGLTEVERRSLREALARCSDLSALIQDVLQMNRTEEGQLELYMETVELVELTRSSTEAFALVAEQGSRQLTFHGPETPVSVRTDQTLLRRILYNLIRNALQHTPAGTRVKVSVQPGPPWTVRVEDDGPGIPGKIRDRIFEPGAIRSAGLQVQSGLGLVFSKQTADALGMALRLDSETKQGTCFILEECAGTNAHREDSGRSHA